ncbi:MAG: carbohydrate ABC transporter substrate-binding protein [Oligoflexales bacterium]|nr:carbohydrate ABC transporter substrate-binding protein [Oligoflexales bacterium]
MCSRMTFRYFAPVITGIGLVFFSTGILADEIEVLHWWTSGSESQAIDVLKNNFSKAGDIWKDSVISGGGGVKLKKALKARIGTGTPPSAVQIKAGELKEWGDMGAFEDMTPLAVEMGWDKMMPKVILESLKYRGKYVAVPVNIHRHNWLWINNRVFEKSGAKIPTTLDELFEAAEKIRKAGFIAIAHGGEEWQDATMFEEIIFAVGGAELHKKAFVDLDIKTLGSAQMIKVFDAMRKIGAYLPKDRKGLAWEKATALLIDGKAGMQFMGDWAKGEFLVKGKKPGIDFSCVPSPGSSDSFLYISDTLGMFKTKKSSFNAQKKLARLVLDEKFQVDFNLKKGSIPARLDVPMNGFDECAKKSNADFAATAKTGRQLPSLVHGMVVNSDLQNAIMNVVSKHLNTADMKSEYAAKKLASAVKEAAL